jgi:hypothetical protein
MKTYCIIFAGRKDRMELTMNYIQRALDETIFDEVHLWNYTRSLDDEAWVRSLESDKIKIFDVADKKDKWREVWGHYDAATHKDDVFFKIDDDMVHIDLESLTTLKKITMAKGDNFHLAVPVILNSMSDKVNLSVPHRNRIPVLSANDIDFSSRGWGVCHGKEAEMLHYYFLSASEKFGVKVPDAVVPLRQSLHTHIAAFKGARFEYIQEYISRDDWHDEIVNTVTLTNDKKIDNWIIPTFGGCHLSFGSQDPWMNISHLLELYRVKFTS